MGAWDKVSIAFVNQQEQLQTPNDGDVEEVSVGPRASWNQLSATFLRQQAQLQTPYDRNAEGWETPSDCGDSKGMPQGSPRITGKHLAAALWQHIATLQEPYDRHTQLSDTEKAFDGASMRIQQAASEEVDFPGKKKVVSFAVEALRWRCLTMRRIHAV